MNQFARALLLALAVAVRARVAAGLVDPVAAARIPGWLR